MINALFVGAGGFIGAVMRYVMGQIPLPIKGGFPIMTLVINILGAFLIGIISAAAGKYFNLDSRMVLFIKTGICGGFTTFSTFSLECSDLLSTGKQGYAVVYMVLSVVCCILAVWAGKQIVGV